jgi:signal transduction histidine kinase
MQFVLSQERLERFQLFISHDVKNIAQFIGLLKNQVKNSKSEKEKLALIERLDRLLPSLSEKAKKITSHMRYDKAFFDDVEQVCLLEKIKYYADANEISIELDQRASKISINLSQTLLQQVITEILNNFKVHADVTTIKIDVLEEDGVILIIFKAKRDVELHIKSERLFEPFWTTSKSGMGLGLFVTREILKEIGGKIEFVQNKKELSFCVTLPHLCKGLPVIK